MRGVCVRRLWMFWLVLAVLLSVVMCAVVGFAYSDMLWGIRYAGYSAPAGVAFLYAVPFLAGIALCVALAVFSGQKNH